MSEGCHGTEAARTLAASKDFTPPTFSNGKLEFHRGGIPLQPGLLDWPFLEKKDGQWVPFESTKRPRIHMGVYAESFPQEELKKLASK